MKLKEFEARQLLQAVGIPVSPGQVINQPNQIPNFTEPKMLKVQTLAGGRGKAGGIIIVNNQAEAVQHFPTFLGQEFLGETINEILLTEKVDFIAEYYLGIMFDTSKKCPVLIFSQVGGVDVEEVKRNNPEKIIIKEINYAAGLTQSTIAEIISTLPNQEISDKLTDVIKKLYHCFIKFDCKMIEINPLALTKNNILVALDAVAVLDDDAKNRREVHFTPRTNTRQATAREIAARKIDAEDHRGVAGKTFLDLDGDIAILTSGGGASMTLMDALIESGGKPANFTEYSGDPPTEKVEKLTRIVLDKPNLSGLLIAGVIANFTNIADTLKGVINVLEETKPNFPIVIRRAGPFDQEAKDMVQKAKVDFGFDIHFFDESTPLTKSVEIMLNLSNEYKNKLEKGAIQCPS
jgi:citryl-CoA synthetase large subunit